MSLAAEELRAQIATVVAGGAPSQTPALPTGLPQLDALLPGRGIPPGRLTELLAPAGLGKTSIARAIVATTLAAGHGVAWVDATRTLDPRDWAELAGDGLWVVRPPEATRGAWCADLLLRTGAFALVVLDGAPVLSRTLGVRFAHLARETDSALLLLGDGTRASDHGGVLRLRVGRDRAVTLEKGGPYHHVRLDIPYAASIARRLCTHPEVPDRRGVARRPTRLSRELRSRRCAQPDYPVAAV
ncbi:MAG: hypothetical protein WD771_04130 [Gemmatimonadaceae bacterium]